MSQSSSASTTGDFAPVFANGSISIPENDNLVKYAVIFSVVAIVGFVVYKKLK